MPRKKKRPLNGGMFAEAGEGWRIQCLREPGCVRCKVQVGESLYSYMGPADALGAYLAFTLGENDVVGKVTEYVRQV